MDANGLKVHFKCFKEKKCGCKPTNANPQIISKAPGCDIYTFANTAPGATALHTVHTTTNAGFHSFHPHPGSRLFALACVALFLLFLLSQKHTEEQGPGSKLMVDPIFSKN